MSKYNLSDGTPISEDTKFKDVINEIIDSGSDTAIYGQIIKVENAGAVLASVREEKKISQTEVAKRLNRKQPQVSAWEKIDSEIKVNQVSEMASALDVTPLALLLKVFSEGTNATIIKDLPIKHYERLAAIIKEDIYNEAQKRKEIGVEREKLWAS